MNAIALLLSPIFCLTAAAKDIPVMQNATVISQDIGSRDRGQAFVPLFGSIYAVPLTRSWNRVIVQTSQHRMEWVEKGNKFIVLPVHGTISFYQDKEYFIVLDSRGKKHKFILIGMEQLNGTRHEIRTAPGATSPAPGATRNISCLDSRGNPNHQS
jgi:hypothetical protein